MDTAEEMRHVTALVGRRLIRKFPELDPHTVEETVSGFHRQLGDAPIRDYVPVLVEREAIDSLKARTRARDGGAV